MRPLRRLLLALPLVPLLPLLPRAAHGAGATARVTRVSGGGGTALLPDGTSLALSEGLLLPDGSRIETRPDGLAELALQDGTRVHSGADTRIALVASASGAQGTASLTMVGVMVVDRREVPGGGAMTVSGEGFDVDLAGAQVFIESLRAAGGTRAVFVAEGGAAVRSDAGEVLLASGEGVDLAPGFAAEPAPDTATAGAPAPAVPSSPGAPPAPAVARWSAERVADAFASVGLVT